MSVIMTGIFERVWFEHSIAVPHIDMYEEGVT